jgi:CDP-4-dehydro-6-deoxyglucose reductase, E1
VGSLIYNKMKHDLRYGGAMCGAEEQAAIIKSVKKSIKNGNWQTGEEARLFEEESAKFLGTKYGILTNSGSSAGLLALASLELPRGSEVIISACTFPTIFNIILQCNLVPVVVDAKVGSYTFDIDEVMSAVTEKTGAIIAIHPCGNPVDMPLLMSKVKKLKQKIYVIEDNCDGWGSSINGKKVGSFGDISITSFHAAHIVTMGVGGGVYTNDKDTALRVRQYRDWGRQANTQEPHKVKALPDDYDPRFVYDKIGYNFQILELQAAMGRVQLKKSKQIKEARKKNFDYLVKELDKLPLIMPTSPKKVDVCWFALPITVCWPVMRGPLVAHLNKHGIETRSMFAGDITKHPAYAKSKYRKHGRLTEANMILKDSFWITVHPRLKQKDLEYIVSVFETYFNDSTA